MIRINLQRFAKTVSVNNSSSSSHTSSSSSTSSKTKSVKKDKSNTIGKSNTSSLEKNHSVSKTENATVKSADTLAAEKQWNALSNYEEGERATDAYEKKLAQEAALAQKGEYQSNYKNTIDNLLNDILNGKKFEYDFNADPLYQKYKDMYTQQGKEAMQNTMAAASALTGGYGSSYATTAASQAYQDYMTQADDKIPELYQLALQTYDAEQQQKYNQFNVVGSQEDREYGQYSDDYQRALDLASYYQSGYASESQRDRDIWGTELSNAQAKAEYLYNQDYSTKTTTDGKTTGKSKTNSTSTTTSKSTDTTTQHSSTSSSSNTSSSSSSSNTSQATLLKGIDSDELSSVKNYVDNEDTQKALDYINGMRKSGKYTDKQIANVLVAFGLREKK